MLSHQKEEIVGLIEAHRESLGSQLNVANRCEVSEATISQMRNGNWEKIKDTMWRKVGIALGWQLGSWQTVETENSRLLFQTYDDAKETQLWLAVAANAGSGKTTAAKSYEAANRHRAAYYLQAREWRGRAFLRELAQSLGLPVTTKDHTDEMIMKIATFFQERADLKPVVIIDEADKLHPQAIRSLIPLYNQLSSVIGVVLQGTPNLKRQFENGCQWAKKGYEELMSRFGGEFVDLPGMTKRDVLAICAANGLEREADQLEAWEKTPKEQTTFLNRRTVRARDGRRVERIIKSKLFTLSIATQ